MSSSSSSESITIAAGGPLGIHLLFDGLAGAAVLNLAGAAVLNLAGAAVLNLVGAAVLNLVGAAVLNLAGDFSTASIFTTTFESGIELIILAMSGSGLTLAIWLILSSMGWKYMFGLEISAGKNMA